MKRERKTVSEGKDLYEKHKINAIEKDFLKGVQKEINTQDHFCQADPRFWVIRDYEKMYGKELDHFTGIALKDKITKKNIYETECFSRDCESIKKELYEILKKYGASEESLHYINSTCRVGVLKEEIIDAIENDELELSLYEYEEYPVESGFFFTYKAAGKHLYENDYHYSNKAHVYCKTAWRTAEEPLWDILHNVDFEML